MALSHGRGFGRQRSIWNIDDLPVVRGWDWVRGPRNSGRTFRMIEDALHQIDFLEKGDEVWLVFTTWQHAKRVCERVANGLAAELGFKVFVPGDPGGEDMTQTERNLVHRWGGEPNRVRYYLMIEDIAYHFVSIESLETQLRGIRFRTGPCVYFDHSCYEFSREPMDDLYPLLSDASCSLQA